MAVILADKRAREIGASEEQAETLPLMTLI